MFITYRPLLLFRDNIHHLLVRLLRFLFSSNNLAQDNTTTAAAAIATSVSSILELLGKRLYQTILVQAFATPCSRYICRTNCRTYLTQTFCPTLEPTFVASCSAGISLMLGVLHSGARVLCTPGSQTMGWLCLALSNTRHTMRSALGVHAPLGPPQIEPSTGPAHAEHTPSPWIPRPWAGSRYRILNRVLIHVSS